MLDLYLAGGSTLAEIAAERELSISTVWRRTMAVRRLRALADVAAS